jgi:outer membrane protein assembly factor BamB
MLLCTAARAALLAAGSLTRVATAVQRSMARIGVARLAASLIAFGVVAAAVSSPAAAAGQHPAQRSAVDWPHFRFDAKHTGYQRFETTLDPRSIQSAQLLWHDFLGGELVDMSSAAVVDGIAYIGEFDGNFAAYAADGCGSDDCQAPLWAAQLFSIYNSPAVADGLVYIGSQTSFDDGAFKLNAFSAAGCGQAVCSPLWQGDAGPVSSSSSPTVWRGRVFIGGGDGNVYAFHAEGCGKALCKPLWKGRMSQGTQSTAVIYKGTLLIGNQDGKLYAFNAAGCGQKVCQPLWTADTHAANFTSSPAVADGVVYIAGDHALSAIDANGCGAKTCEPLWQALDKNLFFDGSPAVANGRVYIGLESQLDVYDANGCGHKTCNAIAVLFGSGMQDAIVSSPTVANGVVYAGRNSGELLAWPESCVAKGGCDEIWKGILDDPLVTSSPTVVNGKIYIGGSEHGFGGRLYVFGLQP